MLEGNKTQYALLGALSLEPMSGYEIKKMMENSTNYFWTESNGQIYPTLKKLAKAKLVTIEMQMIGAKQKKVYSLTKSGKQRLQQWLKQDYQDYPARDELLLKLFYGQNVAPEVSIHHIQNHLKKCQKMLGIYQEIEQQLTTLVEQNKQPVYFLVTVKAGVRSTKNEIAWCEESIQLIEKYT